MLEEHAVISGYNVAERNGAPAKSRFSDPVALRSVYDHLKLEDAKDAVRRARIRKMYNAYLPYDPATLEKCGIKHITNVNWLGLKGVIDNRSDTLLRLACDTANLVSLLPLARELAGPDAERIARVVSEEFSMTLRETGKVIPALSMMNKEADLYGLGPVTWPNPTDYNPVALERAQVLFVGDGPVNSSDHELFMFETTIPASYMFSLLDHPDIAEAAGWDLAAVKEWIVNVFRDNLETRAEPGTEGGVSYIESAVSLVRQNRFEEEHQFQRLHVIHAFVREMAFPRGVTHLIMPATEQKRFLFRRANAYPTMDQCFLWFPYSCNERYARAVRGLASFLYPIELVNNRYKCRVVDLAFQNASLIFSQGSIGSQQQLTLNEQGPYTIVPRELTPIQSNVRPDMNSVMAFSQFVDNIGINSVTGGDKQQISQTGPKLQETGRQTKFEAEIQQRLRSHKEEALFVQRMSVLDKVFRETFRRFVTLATSNDPILLADYPEIAVFLRRCAQRGVTPEMLAQVPSMFIVITCRDLVLGSEGKVGALSEILGSFGSMADEVGRKSMFRDIVQLRLGDQAADRYAAEVSRDSAPSDQSSFATLENNMMRQGLPAMVGVDQLHWAHIPVHAQVLQEIVDTVRAPDDNAPAIDGFGEPTDTGLAIGEQTLRNTGSNPRRLLALLEMVSTHVQEHVKIGGQQIGMEERAKQVMSMIRDLRPTVKALNLAVATQERVEQAQREQAERDRQKQIDQAAEEKARVAEIDADRKAAVDKYRVDREHEVAMYKAQMESGRADAQAEREARRAAGDEARRDAEADARIDMQRKMLDAKLNMSRAANRQDVMNKVTGYRGTSPSDFVEQQEESPDFVTL